MGRMEGDTVEGSLGVVVVAERSVALGTSGESSQALTSVDSDLPAWGKPVLRWTNLQDPASTLFTLDDAGESME